MNEVILALFLSALLLNGHILQYNLNIIMGSYIKTQKSKLTITKGGNKA